VKEILTRIKHIKPRDVLAIVPFVIALLPSLLLKRRRPALWLICEDENEARDNGYWLFRYIQEHYPAVDVIYAINKTSPDYSKVAALGNVTQYGSLAHWIYYLAAAVNISSQKGGKPNAALCFALEISGILKNKRVFLHMVLPKMTRNGSITK